MTAPALTTRIRDKVPDIICYPQTSIIDYYEYSEMSHRLYKQHLKGRISREEFINQRKLLLVGDFNDKIHMQDYYMFASHDLLEQFLRKIHCSEEHIAGSIGHELEHAAKADELGVEYSFGCILTHYVSGSYLVPKHVTPEKIVPVCCLFFRDYISAEHDRAIRAAASDPSHTDW